MPSLLQHTGKAVAIASAVVIAAAGVFVGYSWWNREKDYGKDISDIVILQDPQAVPGAWDKVHVIATYTPHCRDGTFRVAAFDNRSDYVSESVFTAPDVRRMIAKYKTQGYIELDPTLHAESYGLQRWLPMTE
jgi:hypothetical protein